MTRQELHDLLLTIMNTDYVYFQPPPSIQMTYPCIVYKKNRAKTKFAENKPYSHRKAYQITVIDRNPDSDIPDKIAALPMCTFDRCYTADNLNHDVYTIFL